MVWARLCMLGRVVLVARPSQGPLNSNSGLRFSLSMNSWFYMNFNHPMHSLEGSRLNSCPCVVMVLVMVASLYVSFYFYFSSSEAYSSWSGPGCACWGGGSWC
jgi:hypothetical protein